MGFLWRCCPALMPRSIQPVKRYKKLIADIFSKFHDSQSRDQKLIKLCEYAAKNPSLIPKITRLLEERFYKGLQHERVKIVSIVMDIYNKLLSMCGKQMAFFATSLLTLTHELSDPSKQVSLQIAGYQTLTNFINSQIDRSYAPNIDRYVKRVCKLAREKKEEHEQHSLRALCLQCLSAMVWYMDAFFRASDDIGEVVHVMLDHYEYNTHNEERNSGDVTACFTSVRLPPEKKNISSLTREEIEDPRIWAQICLHRMAELAKESTTMRQVLEPMFVYFDTEHHWYPHHGLAAKVLCDMSYFAEDSGKKFLILNGVIRHMDHKNVAHDPALKSYVAQVATNLAQQIRFGPNLSHVRCVDDLLRHLRKSLQVTTREEDSDANTQLQYSIISCLLAISKGIDNPWPLFNVMIISLENMSLVGVIAQATMGSLLILAHVLIAVYPHLQQVFPEALLVQLLKAMLHPDVEARILAHQIFSVFLFPKYETKRWKSRIGFRFDSATTLLQKETNNGRDEKCGNGGADDISGRKFLEDEHKLAWTSKKIYSIYKLYSIIGQIVGANSFPKEPCAMKLSEDQILLLLCAFWHQINFSDNLPPNFEAITHSYCLTLISSDIKSSSDSLIRIFQLPLSLREISLSSSCGKLPPACRRAIVVTSTAMLLFAASKMYQTDNKLNNLLRSEALSNVDPYLGINEDLQVCVKPEADLIKYGSAEDNHLATNFLSELSNKKIETKKDVLKIIVRHLCNTVQMKEEEVLSQLSAPFSPDDLFIFAPKDLQELYLNQGQHQLKECSSDLDDDSSTNSVLEADVTSASLLVNISAQKRWLSPSNSDITSIDEPLESVDELASQLVGTSVPTPPLSYRAMARHSESRTRANISIVFRNPIEEQAIVNHALPCTAATQDEYPISPDNYKYPTPPFDNFKQFSDETLLQFELVDQLFKVVKLF